MKRFENVKCYYTGGGVYVYSALYNGEVWLYGGLDWYFGSYSIPGEEIEAEHDNDYDTYWKVPSIPYPTWNEILQSILDAYPEDDHPEVVYMERQILDANPDMNARCIGPDDTHDYPPDDPSSDRIRLETVSAFLDVFNDYLESKGYDTDDTYTLSDEIETLLYKFGTLKGE